MKTIALFTDGSSHQSQEGHRYGGYGIYFPSEPLTISQSCRGSNATNQRMELRGCLDGIRRGVTLGDHVMVYTDSMYTINCITKWASNWKANQWKRPGNAPICNLDIIRPLYGLYKKHSIEFIHVPSHQSEPEDKDSHEHWLWHGNYMADKLAWDAMKKIRRNNGP